MDSDDWTYIKGVLHSFGLGESSLDRRRREELSAISNYNVQLVLDEGNVQKGVSDVMRGALIETEARTILNRGKDEAKKETALRMLQDGESSFDKIAKYSGLTVADVEQLAER